MENRIAVELRHIKKHFGPVKANDDVNLKVRAGEIHAILGENGSGKSTLMNVLSGLYAPDGGEILIGGTPVCIRSPKDAILNGIGMIHQHFKLVDALCAWENIVGGMKTRTLLRKKRAIAEIMTLCEKYGLPLDPEKKICGMSVGEKQTVEIVKALYRGAEVLILDEPTAVLTVQETERLFEILREMRAKGRAVIIITHKLQEVMNVSDRVTVLRKGVSVDSIVTAQSSPSQLAELMVGRTVDISVPYAQTPPEQHQPVLSIRNLHLTERGAGETLNIDRLDVCACEILGIAGVADSGQRELCESIVGLRAAEGSVLLKETELIGLDSEAMLRQGIRIGFVPEDRLGMGLAAGLSISDNAALRTYRSDHGPFLNKKAETVQAVRLTEHYHVSAFGVEQPIQSLSGGNIQKVLLGREIDRGADLFIAAYPVRGLDIGASNFIYEKLNEEKQKGVAILFVGEDLDVLLGLCDRIAVLHGGELMGVVDAKAATKEQLGLLMMGQRQREECYAAN
ncbi:ABC transporter ATP-binding protein [Oscillibacter sp.]|uniref:ABC transporter ATP-binding protein n=1 Tax=Oscillibacter sp. TaxID=1945593 RepID=UPI0028A81A77|nr:ABC transporter ATP-binding protein [Oscillibacter sp.]